MRAEDFFSAPRPPWHEACLQIATRMDPDPAALPYGVAPVDLGLPPDIARARRLARLLDHHMLDPVLGFVLPGIGDLLGSLIGLYLVAVALRHRISPIVVARMLLNLALDAAIGFLPLAGDLADVAFKANTRNLALLLARHDTGRATPRDWLAVGGAAAAFLVVTGLLVYAVFAVLRAIA